MQKSNSLRKDSCHFSSCTKVLLTFSALRLTGVSPIPFGRCSVYPLHTHAHTPSGSFYALPAFFPSCLGPWVPPLLPGTHRVCVLGGKLGMRWISLQVTLKSSSWRHSQGGDGHLCPPRLLGRTRSSARGRRGVGCIVLGAPGYLCVLRDRLPLIPLRLGLLGLGETARGGREEGSMGL